MCSRVLGLAREQIAAALFGGGGAMDAFTAAFRIPNLLRDLFAEGALSTAFVTTFSKTIARGGDEARLAARQQGRDADGGGARRSACSASCSRRSWSAALAPGFRPAKAALTVTLTRIMFPFILLVSLAALVMGMLNARNVFGMPAMASSFFNIGSIVVGVLLGSWLDPHFGTARADRACDRHAGGRRAAACACSCRRWRAWATASGPDFTWRDPGMRAILRADGAVGDRGQHHAGQRADQFDVRLRARRRPDLLAAIAFRLMQLPLGLFGVALGTVTLPLLSRLVVAGNLPAFRAELSRGMRLAFLLTIPAAVGLMMLAEPIISVLYQHGRFDAHADRAGGRRAALLRHRPVRLCGAQSAGECLLRASTGARRRCS